MFVKDYYKILSIPSTADSDDIKKRYYKLAQKYHPDTSEYLNSTEKFQEINEAYRILSDEYNRKVYDSFLEAQKEETISEHPSPTRHSSHPPRYKEFTEQQFAATNWLKPLGFALWIISILMVLIPSIEHKEIANINWTSTKATLVNALTTSRTQDGRPMYFIQCNYKYLVDNEKYFYIGRSEFQRTRHSEMQENKTHPDEITIYYDPQEPWESREYIHSEEEVPESFEGFYVFGAICFVLGAIFVKI